MKKFRIIIETEDGELIHKVVCDTRQECLNFLDNCNIPEKYNGVFICWEIKMIVL